jgi:hypothetical protein
MVLAIPYFASSQNTPVHIAYMPEKMIRRDGRGYRCMPALFKVGRARPRRDHRIFFDDDGLRNLEKTDFKEMEVVGAGV